MTRLVLLALLPLTACNLYFGTPTPPPPPDAPNFCGERPAGETCVCTAMGWNCGACPFPMTYDNQACTNYNDTCEIVSGMDGCTCTCGADLYWRCVPQTVNSVCPYGPVYDAGVVDVPPPYPDAALPDASNACVVLEAESVSPHPGWSLAAGSVLHGGGALSADAINSAVAFSFAGTALTAYAENGPTMGVYRVQVDARPAVYVNARTMAGSPYTFGNATVIETGLASGTHTATVSCVSLECELDYFEACL